MLFPRHRVPGLPGLATAWGRMRVHPGQGTRAHHDASSGSSRAPAGTGTPPNCSPALVPTSCACPPTTPPADPPSCCSCCHAGSLLARAPGSSDARARLWRRRRIRESSAGGGSMHAPSQGAMAACQHHLLATGVPSTALLPLTPPPGRPATGVLPSPPPRPARARAYAARTRRCRTPTPPPSRAWRPRPTPKPRCWRSCEKMP